MSVHRAFTKSPLHKGPSSASLAVGALRATPHIRHFKQNVGVLDLIRHNGVARRGEGSGFFQC
jgi:hypothetical protein